MILFKTFVEVPDDFMCRFGFRNIMTYNLSSYIGGFNELTELINIGMGYTGPYDEIEFDIAYSNFITSNNRAFMEMMMPIMDTYNNPDILVQILISHSPYRDCITENLIKVIQQRYGLNSYIVNTIEDLYYISEDPDFDIDGLTRLNQDLDRYSAIVGTMTGELYRDVEC